tara:strand:+ start:607 stop:939 length:333 start_codon:yes stop_codon:yes gene_type:complete
MDQKNYTKMLDNNNQQVLVSNERVNRFLGEGWQLLSSQEKSPVSTKLELTVNAQVTKPKKSRSKKKKQPEPDYIDEVKYDMDAEEGEDILLPEDLNHEDDVDYPDDKKED